MRKLDDNNSNNLERSVTILVVDDDEDCREMLKFLLENSSFRVLLAATAGEALRAVVNDKPDLIVTDLGLPDTDGLEFVRQLRKSPTFQSIPIIMISAFDLESYSETALEYGCDLILAKPFDVDTLKASIHRLLRTGRKSPHAVRPRRPHFGPALNYRPRARP
jgi:DNA-binding response OmpR family regulator